VRAFGLLQSFRFSPFQFSLAMFGSFNGICSRLELCFLDEVAPAFVPIVGILGILERLQFRFGVVLAPHHSDHASGAVGADVVPDDGVRGIEVVACQKESIPKGRLETMKPAVSRARSSRLVAAMLSAPRITSWFAKKLRPGFVHSHGTAVQDLSIQSCDSAFSLSRICHLDKSDPTRLARVPVHDDPDGFDGSVCAENLLQLLLRGGDIEVSDKNVDHELIPLLIFYPRVSLRSANDL